MGTPDFAVPSLQKLLDAGHNIVGVVTATDKPAGRGQQMRSSPIKALALAHRLPIVQPERLDAPEFFEQLRLFNADLFVVVAFRILPEAVLKIPPRGAINLHASLLPKYRGAAPINWAIIRGETVTGVTTFFIDKMVDTGEILLQESTPIGAEMTAGELHDVLAHLGADLMLRTVNGVADGSLKAQPQVGEATRAPKLTRELEVIDWSRPARELRNLIRGLAPTPGCTTTLHGRQIKILSAAAVDPSASTAAPGTVIAVQKEGAIWVQTGEGALNLLQLKPEGKKAMSASEFLRGYRLKAGDVFR